MDFDTNATPESFVWRHLVLRDEACEMGPDPKLKALDPTYIYIYVYIYICICAYFPKQLVCKSSVFFFYRVPWVSHPKSVAVRVVASHTVASQTVASHTAAPRSEYPGSQCRNRWLGHCSLPCCGLHSVVSHTVASHAVAGLIDPSL